MCAADQSVEEGSPLAFLPEMLLRRYCSFAKQGHCCDVPGRDEGVKGASCSTLHRAPKLPATPVTPSFS